MIDANNMFQPNPYNAPVVTDIFTRYSVGESIIDILNDLKSKGITNRGKPLTYHFINWILKKRRYLGEYSFRVTINYDAIPPLVTPDVFELCQKRLSENKHKPAIKRIIDTCYSMQKTKCPHLAVLKKRLKENQKELDNLINAIKKWIITKSTKKELEKLELSISQEKLKSPVIDKEHIRM